MRVNAPWFVLFLLDLISRPQVNESSVIIISMALQAAILFVSKSKRDSTLVDDEIIRKSARPIGEEGQVLENSSTPT